MFKKIKQKKQKGFTLIEMIVSVGLFAVVLTITLSSILTISDSNKKARSLMSVMTNLNFAIDSMTRSFKTGIINGIDPVTDSGNCLSTNEIDYANTGLGNEFESRPVKYCFVKTTNADGEEVGKLRKSVENINDPNSFVDLTSPDVDIDYLKFTSVNWSSGQQPMVNISIEGTVKVNSRISSNFSIQTSVSQRKLNI